MHIIEEYKRKDDFTIGLCYDKTLGFWAVVSVAPDNWVHWEVTHDGKSQRLTEETARKEYERWRD